MLRQQRWVILNGAVLRNIQQCLRCELQHIRHNCQINLQRTQGLLRIDASEARKLEHRQAHGKGGDMQRVGPCARLIGRAKDGGYLVAACNKSVKRGLAKILLANNGNSHIFF